MSGWNRLERQGRRESGGYGEAGEFSGSAAFPGRGFISGGYDQGRVLTYRPEWRAAHERRGPKGYRRSDERIREDVCERLTLREHLELDEVAVDVHDGRVRLDGEVPERWMKHEIEDIAAGVFGVQDIENRIRVRRGFPGPLLYAARPGAGRR